MKRKIFLFFYFFLLLFLGINKFKKDEFSGSFYPKNKEELISLLDNYFSKVIPEKVNGEIKGIISPHAGYIFSAEVASYGYKLLKENKEIFDTAIILAPSHQYFFEGVAIYPEGKFLIPIGELEVDSDLAKKFSSLNFVRLEEKFFFGEHAIEVQLPFLLKIEEKIKILPILFGKLSYEMMEKLAQKIKEISKEKNILIVCSTDLSHYLSYQEAKNKDFFTLGLIEKKDYLSLWFLNEKDKNIACGIYPLITFLMYAEKENLSVKILKYANSGDSFFSDRKKVVGYVSAVIFEKEEEIMQKLNKEEKIKLLTIARKTLEEYLKNKKIPIFTVKEEALLEKRAAFVTLKKHEQLRGCIGRIVFDKPLYQVVSEMAIEAATADPRFSPVQFEELNEIEIEISALTPFEKVNNLEEIEIGKHGLLIQKGFYSGLLLPQVALEYNWDRETFLEHLCYKAGLSKDAYKDKNTIIYKFSAEVFSEKALKD